MAKRKTGEAASRSAFKCKNCGYTQSRWLGRCPDCGEWNSFEEVISDSGYIPHSGNKEKFSTQVNSIPLEAVPANDATRLSTGIEEFDRVLGGGAVKRSAVLIGGEPGIGKSTMLLQTAAACGKKVLYVSGEESGGQIRARADRLGIPLKKIELLCSCRLAAVERTLNKLNPVFVIIDSIQTMYCEDAGAIPGTINQLKLCSHELISWVKERDSVLFLTAHVTKDGNIAGPKVLEHLVDTVISFERNDEGIRFLRALKNRFGSIDELGIFSMDEKGLQPVEDPSLLFITNRAGETPAGSVAVPIFEGSRSFMVEIQALTVPAKGAVTRVFSDKIDSARISRIAAVIEKRIGLQFSDQDIYVNVAGGIKLKEPAVDIAIALALYSTRTDIAVPKNSAFIGELSLAGEIRPVSKLQSRIKTCESMGFTKIFSPKINEKELSGIDLKSVFEVEYLSDAIKKAFE